MTEPAPLTDAELAEIKDRLESYQDEWSVDGGVVDDLVTLIAEVNRLRGELVQRTPRL